MELSGNQVAEENLEAVISIAEDYMNLLQQVSPSESVEAKRLKVIRAKSFLAALKNGVYHVMGPEDGVERPTPQDAPRARRHSTSKEQPEAQQPKPEAPPRRQERRPDELFGAFASIVTSAKPLVDALNDLFDPHPKR